jgi:hypothetical protein
LGTTMTDKTSPGFRSMTQAWLCGSEIRLIFPKLALFRQPYTHLLAVC